LKDEGDFLFLSSSSEFVQEKKQGSSDDQKIWGPDCKSSCNCKHISGKKRRKKKREKEVKRKGEEKRKGKERDKGI
jgi:hypothetical protein